MMLVNRTNLLKIALWSVPAFVIIVLILSIEAYRIIYAPNLKTPPTGDSVFYVATGTSFEALCEQLNSENRLVKEGSFRLLARRMKFRTARPGRYLLQEGMSNLDLIRMFRSGAQTPLRVTFNNIRNTESLAAVLARQLEPDSAAFADLFSDTAVMRDRGFSPETFPALFIPNTYEFFWNTSPEQFLDRILREYEDFWTPLRKQKADSLGLTPLEVSTLASIVEEETKKNDEKKRVAGVYLNRLSKGIPLQADPTVKFALGDPGLRRILHKHLSYKSPYNTYLNPGLPPGPICFPEISSLDAVLFAENHTFYFFCAREDFSGYHNFATTLSEHNKNARAYHAALTKAGIQ